MSMQVAKKGARPGIAKANISVKLRTLSFSAELCRAYNLVPSKHKYALVGFDKLHKNIGLSFLTTIDKDGNAMKLTWTPKKTSFAFPVRLLLTSFSLDINQISGAYLREDAITEKVEIKGFAKEGYLLHTQKRNRT